MKILGVGIDCEKPERFKKVSQQFIKNTFVNEEIEYCNSKANPHQHFAARFVAKEAAIKAFSSMGLQISFKNLEIIKKNTWPEIKLKDVNLNTDYNVHLSMSHIEDLAMAMVIVSGEENGEN